MKTKSLLYLAGLTAAIQFVSCAKNDLDSTADLSQANEVTTATEAVTTSARVAAMRIEAESYSGMSGVQTEDCREGGKNVGYIHVNDWMDYSITPAAAGSQTISFRVAGPGGKLRVQKADGTVLATVTLPVTAGGQIYATGSATISLPAGKQTLRIVALTAGWNFNWFELSGGVATTVPPTTTNPTTPTTPTTPTAPSTGANVALYSSFEDASDFNKWIKEICRSSALQISSEVPARKGKYAARFEFTKDDVINYNKYVRAEIRQSSDAEQEKWFGFSNYLPGDFVTDPLAEKIAQWHEVPDWDLGENWRSPPISFGIENGRYYVQILWAAAAVNTNDSKDGEKKVDLGPVDKMKWNDWVFHIKFSYKSDGILEIFKNKVKVYSQYGPNSFNDKFYPYFKIGIYKWGWNGWASYSPENKRVLYYDEVRIGNKNSNLNEVSPQ
ncbi:heparin lyase I family protein [Paraflavitalea sp. CAU 1676]|uniref:heparin lyase I family protein n=1 Tax=Paraflavitalea sp. CAU 1676 TaxID=3032598 RepID=UPI0023D9F64E|nr:heparin lyase I family protein [Paraflavitalea sp. CAU 1676]MDF2188474.1 heparin lyase I family protein [Paraflavitalea sp. CAU 1676]